MKKKQYSFKNLANNELMHEGFGSIRNMICENGINKKRNGWHVIGEFRDEEGQPLKINGIFEFSNKEKTVLVVHAGTSFYECDYDMNVLAKIPVKGGLEIKDEKSCGCMYGDYLWLAGGSGLLIYDGKRVERPYERDLAYVPITSAGIHQKDKGIQSTHPDAPNLLTKKRKNLLKGTRNLSRRHVFRLDSYACYGKPFSIVAKFRVASDYGNLDEWISRYVGKGEDGLGIETVVSVTIYVPSLREGVIVAYPFALDESGAVVEIDHIEYSFEVKNGRDLIIDFDAVSPFPDMDNIEVSYTALMDDENVLDNVKQISLGSTENGYATMLLSTGDNNIYYSCTKDSRMYFGKNNKVTVGKDPQGICGILPMQNNFIGIYKESSLYTLKIYENEAGKYKLFFNSSEVGSTSPYTVKSLNGDCLALSQDGVFGMSDSESAEHKVSRLYNRSLSISKELNSLTREEKSKAFAITCNEEYWLFVGGRIYICTPKYKIKGARVLDFSYQWWVFENCPCECAIYASKRVYMGREDGKITSFDSEYTDRDTQALFSKNADFVFSQDDYLNITFDSCFDIKEDDIISMSSHYIYGLDGEYVANDRLVYISPGRFFDEKGSVAFYKGQKISLYTLDGTHVYDGKIEETYPDRCGIYLGEVGLNTDTPLAIYLKKDEKTEYELIKNGNGFLICYNKIPIKVLDADISTVYIKKGKEVECELEFPVTDLGIRGEKSLYGICVTPSEDSRCEICIGYETKTGSYEKRVRLNSTLDFDSFDYSDTSFSKPFLQNITVPFFERSFEYIRVKISSPTGKGLGLHSASLIYTTKK